MRRRRCSREAVYSVKVKFLGTGAAEGIPGVFCNCSLCSKARRLKGKDVRTRASIQLDPQLKIDLPPDTYMHTLTYDVDLSSLKHLLITHSHEDHFYVEELRMRSPGFTYVEPGEPLVVYGNSMVYEAVSSLQKIEGYIEPRLVKPFERFRVGEYKVQPLPADHDEREDCLLYLIEIGGVTVLHGYDTGWFPEETWRTLRKTRIDLAVLDCTMGLKPSVRYHMGVEAIGKVRERMIAEGIAGGDTVFVASHFSHNGGLTHQELEDRLKPLGFTVAYDGLELRL